MRGSGKRQSRSVLSGQPLRLPGAGERGDVAGRAIVLIALRDSRGSSRTAAGSSRARRNLAVASDQPMKPVASGSSTMSQRGLTRGAARAAALQTRAADQPDRPPQIERRRGDAEHGDRNGPPRSPRRMLRNSASPIVSGWA